MQPLFAPEQIVSYALEGWIENKRLDEIAKSRTLTQREAMEQSVAAIKLIVFGPVLMGMIADRVFRRR